MTLPFTPAVAADLTWVAIPGVLSLVFGLRLPKGGRVLLWAIVVLQALGILAALSNLGAGDSRGLAQLALPIATLVLVLRKDARAFLTDRHAAPTA
ncbi:hypothetical protein [Marinitenerispora sediminis]|uniref:hypothetical protein n=1 Tax=Marinitenerispora sediminis TaxID=1931232 RepID=UPI001F48AA73|nr:hypothetical protein [Marinitenerispora sediminis]